MAAVWIYSLLTAICCFVYPNWADESQLQVAVFEQHWDIEKETGIRTKILRVVRRGKQPFKLKFSTAPWMRMQ